MQFSPTEHYVLTNLLVLGDDIPANIADRSGFHTASVSRAIKGLREQGLVVQKEERPVYTLTPAGYRAARGQVRQSAFIG